MNTFPQTLGSTTWFESWKICSEINFDKTIASVLIISLSIFVLLFWIPQLFHGAAARSFSVAHRTCTLGAATPRSTIWTSRRSSWTNIASKMKIRCSPGGPRAMGEMSKPSRFPNRNGRDFVASLDSLLGLTSNQERLSSTNHFMGMYIDIYSIIIHYIYIERERHFFLWFSVQQNRIWVQRWRISAQFLTTGDQSRGFLWWWCRC